MSRSGCRADIFGDILIRHQHADMPRAEPEHDGAVGRLHGLPVLVEVDARCPV